MAAKAPRYLSRDEMATMSHDELAAHAVQHQLANSTRRRPVVGDAADVAGVGATRLNPVPQFFKVQAPGYSGQFTTMSEARKEFNAQKKALLKREQAFTLKLYSKESAAGKWELVDELKINEDYFG